MSVSQVPLASLSALATSDSDHEFRAPKMRARTRTRAQNARPSRASSSGHELAPAGHLLCSQKRVMMSQRERRGLTFEPAMACVSRRARLSARAVEPGDDRPRCRERPPRAQSLPRREILRTARLTATPRQRSKTNLGRKPIEPFILRRRLPVDGDIRGDRRCSACKRSF